jgi:cell division protein FtsB
VWYNNGTMKIEELQEKRRIERFILSLPVFAVVSVLIVITLYGIVRTWRIKHSIDTELAALVIQLDEAEKLHLEIEKENEKLSSLDGLEKEARERFNLRRPGESVVVFIDEDSSAVSNEKENDSWFTSLLNFFRSNN